MNESNSSSYDDDGSSSDDSEYAEAREQADRINAMNELKEPLLPSDVKREHRNAVPWWKVWERSQFTLFMFILMCTEWGDVSQVAVIGLAAKYDLWGIILGGSVAHLISIFIAIVLGSMVTKAINEKWLNLIAGLLFFAFAIKEIFAAIYGE